jgi:alpha-L-rhamnosidase
MPRKLLIVIVICAGALLFEGSRFAAQKKQGPTPSRLRCEYLVDPLAIDTREPRLSWVIEGDARGARQSAYQILVASDVAGLAADRGDLWDTGKVDSGRTIQIEYGGKPLVSRRQCHWKVRIWDQNGNPSAWSTPARWAVGLLEPADWSAKWIGDAAPSAENVAATMLRRPFKLAAKPKRAVIYATALGAYELRLNGRRVGDHQLAPEFTDYHTRTQYQAYDVTPMLQAGENVLGAFLGDGWYAGRIGLAEILIQKPRNVYGDRPRLLAQLEMESDEGRFERIVTDASWGMTREGPIRSSDILDGEAYDARREMPGWDQAGFGETHGAGSPWGPAEASTDVGAKLVAQPNEPIRVTRDVKPVSVSEPKPGAYVYDLGQNMVGWVRLTVKGEAGSTVKMRFVEMLNDDGTVYADNLRAAKQTDSYTLKGDGVETFEPRFTYHGFRYVEVTGLPAKPQLGDVVGRQINSDMAETGEFASSSPMLNKLWENILWTQRDNMHGIPTDCPQRDERMGWMGDIQIFVGTGIFNMDMAAFFKKWMRDVRDAQTPDGRFADFSPHPFQKTLARMKRGDFMGVAGWADAGIVVPWRTWQQYGDKRQLAENYESSKRWVEFLRSNNPDLLWKNKRGNDYGDWLNGDTLIHEGWPKKGGELPKEVFATMMFAYAADLLSRMAAALGKTDDAAKYKTLFGEIKTAFNKAYVGPDGKIQGDTQAGYALALHFDLLPENLRGAALDHLLDAIRAYDGRMSTGFHSSYRMMLELTDRGHNDLAYRLINNTTFPSWGYSIENGATTIWERWDGYVKGRGFQDKGMNSFNHYAIGAVGEWMCRVILGINNDDARPAYEHFFLRPRPGGGMTWAKGSYDSIRGKIESSWSLEGGAFKLDVTIPANTSATVYVPATEEARVTESGLPTGKSEGVRFIKMEGASALYEVQSGHYSFRVR